MLRLEKVSRREIVDWVEGVNYIPIASLSIEFVTVFNPQVVLVAKITVGRCAGESNLEVALLT